MATGDKRNPDATTVQARADEFLARFDTLFSHGLILRLPDTCTGATLQFLSQTSYYHHGKTVQTIGFGDWNKEEGARTTVQEALCRFRGVVAAAKEYMKFYRPEHSWTFAFTAFRLPSPLSGTDEAERVAAASARASVERICRQAGRQAARSFSLAARDAPATTNVPAHAP